MTPSPRTRRGALALSALLIVSACSAPALVERAEWTGTVEDRDGVPWVINPDTPLWPDDGAPRLELELEQTFGADSAPADEILAVIRHVAVDGAGNVYIYDDTDFRLVSFDASGDLRWSVGREGEGPEEFLHAHGLVWNGAESLIVANQNGSRLDEWSTDGEYRRSTLLSDLDAAIPSSLGFITPETLLLLPESGPDAEGDALRADANWEFQRAFTLDAAPVTDMPNAELVGAAGSVSGNKIVYGSVHQYEFRIFAPDGALELAVVRPDLGFVPTVIDIEQMSVWTMGATAVPLRVEDRYWITTARWPTNVPDGIAWSRAANAGNRVPREWRHTLDLFDSEGRWLAGRQWDHPDQPDFGYFRTVGPDGKLYSVVQDPYPHVRRYRLDVRPPDEGS